MNHLIPKVVIPAWAETAGSDQYGKYADLDIEGVVQRFRWIEPGTFMMGSPQNEKGHSDNEVQHEVTLTQGFWMADTAVTQAFWLVVMGGNSSHSQGEQLPVEKVSWEDCQQFITRLNQQSGFHLTLPTEAEWEYACRAETTTPYAFGKRITARQANYGQNIGKPVPVKELQPNGWGLYQMHGNVWEWCEDIYSDYLPELVADPQSSASTSPGSDRVIRGGSWSNAPKSVRSAYRDWIMPDSRNDLVGFRLAQAQS